MPQRRAPALDVREVIDPATVGMDAERLGRIDAHFRSYVDDGRLPGWTVAVTRRGRLVHRSNYGAADPADGRQISDDTVFRIYSMTKPITSVAAMMLYEEGAFELTDPLATYLPEFADSRVWKGGSTLAPVTEPITEPLRIWHLLTHTSGLTYGFQRSHPTDALYRDAGYELGAPAGADLAEAVATWASLPLRFQPGTGWCYSVSTDVLGRLVEVLSGRSLDAFLGERVLGPLGMHDTAFGLAEDRRGRLAALHVPDPATKRAVRFDELGPVSRTLPTLLSGGGGLVSTTDDYLRFCDFLLRGGERDGVRLLSPRTIDFMTRNHLPGNTDLLGFAQSMFAETAYAGVGFGLGFSVVVDPVAQKVLGSQGTFAWGGAASTGFFIDPVEQVTAVFMTQLLPSSTWPLRSQLTQLVTQAIVD
ncbi:MAG: serine hydrolase domain-containing protein [Microthrixaceae bacterium]